MELFFKLLIFIIMLGGLIVAHELGHYLAALAVGVRVKEFGVGLPPRLFKLGEWRGTVFSLNWVPFGGYVRPLGEFDPALPGGLAAASPWARLAVFGAGPLVNIVLGFLILVFAFTLGWPDAVRVVEVAPGSPAASAGLRVGDVIVTANAQAMHDPKAWIALIYAHLDQPLTMRVERDGAQRALIIVPSTAWSPEGRPTGVSLERLEVRYALWPAMRRATECLILQVQETALFPARWIAGELQPNEARLSGLVGLKQVSDKMVDKAVASGSWQPVLNLAALVSIALGLTNALPIAALDGGRAAFAALEIIRRRRFNATHEKRIHLVGMVALLGLMVVLIVQDVIHPLF